MLTVEYLLSTYKEIPNLYNQIRTSLIIGNEAQILTAINETPGVQYIKKIEPSFVAPIVEQIKLSILDIDKRTKDFRINEWQQDLLSLYKNHYSPIWRVASFFTNYINNIYEIYKQKE